MNDYERIARIIRFLEENYRAQPDLQALAEVAGLSHHHFHRLFRRWAGTTPKHFVQHLTSVAAGRLLRAGTPVLETALEVGLSGPSRLHDLCVNLEAATPGEIRAGGEGWTIRAGVAETPIGNALIAAGPRGVCHLSFLEGNNLEEAWAEAQSEWPRAHWSKDEKFAREVAENVFDCAPESPSTLDVLVKGSRFQLKVWRALLEIPAGEARSYGELASEIGTPGSARAVGTAVGRNTVGYLIPCHRVIQASGRTGDYRWGTARKKALLAWEQCRVGEAGPS